MQILLPNPTLLAVCAWLEKVLLHFNYTHDDEAKYTVYSLCLILVNATVRGLHH